MQPKTAVLAEQIASLLQDAGLYEALDAIDLARTLVRAAAVRQSARPNSESTEVRHVCP